MALTMFKYKVKNVKGDIFAIMLWKNNLQEVGKHLLDNGLTILEDWNDLKFTNEIFEKISDETELEELKQEVISRQETENSLTQWVADLTTELTELKRDVKRYFELDYQGKNGDGIDDMEAVEYARLNIKLMKVGNEE